MKSSLIDRVICGDSLELLKTVPAASVDLCVSDIPYGISLDDWDVLHDNTNSALLGESPAQRGKSAFKRRGKPINGWSSADREIPREYQAWCARWAAPLVPALKEGASAFIFCSRRNLHRAIVALEDAGFLLRDILCWQKPSAHHRAQRLDVLIANRGLVDEARRWQGWRVGNLAPMWEPIAWFFKPYKVTILDNVIKHELGGINVAAGRTNVLEFADDAAERHHEAQKPQALIEHLINLTTRPGQVVLDPFLGGGTTALAARRLNRRFIGFDINPDYVRIAEQRLAQVVPIQDAPIEAAPIEYAAPGSRKTRRGRPNGSGRRAR